MKQEVIAGRLFAELMDLGIVNEDNEWEVYNRLMQAYSAGFDAGKKAHSFQKAIVQCTTEGKIIEIYESAAEASRKTGVDPSDIGRCAAGKRKAKTAGGFVWKFVNLKDSTASEKQIIESLQSK